MEFGEFSDEASDASLSSEDTSFDDLFTEELVHIQEDHTDVEDNHDQQVQPNEQQVQGNGQSFHVLDPYVYVSDFYFSFDRETFRLMELELQGRLDISIEVIKAHDA
ncbi:hypothetical protein GOP47_0016192 [Adiantum capillus-veneris]|uniref:Uncharacterized protein n=1 Tax=Adiantum capillus-veneris TaxID=13818 RepID=A0A9D4UHM3_ADICA|nr:hypothetical protein GOP47_0016192 [Adiantum capillus-veneris]